MNDTIGKIKKFIKSIFVVLGYDIKKIPKKEDQTICPWKYDDSFNKIFEEVKNATLVDKIRCYMIYQFAMHSLTIEGDIAEVGVYKGGTAKLLYGIFSNKPKEIYLFDTFKGLPPPDPEKDIYKEGEFGDVSLEQVKLFLKDCTDINIYAGIFPESAPALFYDKKFCFVHIDVDIHKSVISCCNFFYSRMTKGGVIIFDDYGFPLCPGAKTAVDEFFKNKDEVPVYLPTGQCIVIRH